MANATSEKGYQQTQELVVGRLGAGDTINVILSGVTRQSRWWDVFLGAFAITLRRPWYVVLTSHRVLVIARDRRSGSPTGIEWDEPRSTVQVDKYSAGRLSGKLFLRRPSDEQILKLIVNFRQRSEALEIKTALEA